MNEQTTKAQMNEWRQTKWLTVHVQKKKKKKKKKLWLSMESCHLEQRLIFSITSTLLRSNPDIDPQSLSHYTNTFWDIEACIDVI